MILSILTTLSVPFLGTALGSAAVLLVRGEMNPRLQKLLLGFASGVMLAAAVWSLIIPSVELAETQGTVPWLPAAVGFMLGMIFLLVLDSLVPHLHLDSDKPEGVRSRASKSTMLVLAVTLHNLPEGMAVGASLAGALSGGVQITFTSAIALAVGIAVQNFPEGAIISLPLHSAGLSRAKSCMLGILSGAAEPVGALLTVAFAAVAVPLLPYLLSFAAGAMIYVVTEELIPESQSGEHSNIGTVGVAVGFVLMMILDTALG